MVDFVLNIRSELVSDLNEFRKKLCSDSYTPLSPPVCGGLRPHNTWRGLGPRPRMLLNWILLASWLSDIASLRFWTRFTKSSWKSSIPYEHSYEHLITLCSFWDDIFSRKILRILNDHFSEPKKSESWYFIRFRTLRNFLDQKMSTALFERRRGEEGGECKNRAIIN